MNKKTTSGLTLVELVITIAVAGILAGLAITSFRDMIQNNRMASHANELISSINLARSEAVKRGVGVKLTASGTSAGNEWGDGWTVWIDTNGDGVIDDTEALKKVDVFSGSVTLDSTNGVSEYSYRADGSFEAGGATGVSEVLELCDPNKTGETGRKINIAPSGRPSVSELTCS